MKKTNIATLILLILAVSACGKNMAVSLKGAAANPPVAGGETGDEGFGKAGANLNVAKSTPTPTPAAGAPAVNPTDANLTALNSRDGILEPWSVYDLSQMTVFPFINKDSGANAIVPIGSPAFTLADGKDGFVKASNFVFRSVNQIQDKNVIQSVAKFSLILKGVRRYNGVNADLKTLANQVLCILPSKICSGDLDSSKSAVANQNQNFWEGAVKDGKDAATLTSPLVSELPVAKESVLLDDQSTLAGTDVMEIDLLKAFGIDQLSTADQVDWIYAHSTDFTDTINHYRKFSFVMGDNVYADSGELDIAFTLNTEPGDFASAPTAPCFGPQDLLTPRRANATVVGGKVVPVPAAVVADKNQTGDETKIPVQAVGSAVKAAAPEVAPDAATIQKSIAQGLMLAGVPTLAPKAPTVTAAETAPELPETAPEVSATESPTVINACPSAQNIKDIMSKRALRAGLAKLKKLGKSVSESQKQALVRQAIRASNSETSTEYAKCQTPAALKAMSASVEASYMKYIFTDCRVKVK